MGVYIRGARAHLSDYIRGARAHLSEDFSGGIGWQI
jgi:hypothetical protein